MNANPKFLNATAHVDEAAVQPLPNSRKVYVAGSRPDIRVPMREISQSDTPASFGAEKNPPIYVYDTSGPYTDPQRENRHPLRPARRCARSGSTSAATPRRWPARRRSYGVERLHDPKLAELRFNLQRKPRRAKPGMNVIADALCAQRHHHAGNGIHRHPREPAPQRIHRSAKRIRPDGRQTGRADGAPASGPELRRRHSGRKSRPNSCATKWRAAARSSRPTSTTPKPSR